MAWTVVQADDGDVHVIPAGVPDRPLPAHDLSRSCACHPEAIRDGPLDDAIWSHQEPDWPGANPGVVH